MKRVRCLLRVSSKRQGDKNDIPVQRIACSKFINQHTDWKFDGEYIELGVSGYKLSESERDVLQDIKRDVLNEEFDILLVFMFDRIGRREEETPFVVEWLIDNNIEVWSVNEGQRKIESRSDKLINYLTYWQAEGESEKISIRATEKRIQMTEDGIYLGYYAPYGYTMVESNQYTKIGKKRRILEIYPQEAKIIKLIFDLIIDKDYGTDKIARYLNKKNVKRRKEGVMWDSTMILEIVRNPIYKGYVSFMKRTRRAHTYTRNKRQDWIIAKEPNKDIIIIIAERWEKANQILNSRSRPGERVIRLLSGFTKCGYCGAHIVPKGKSKYIYMKCKGKQRTGTCKYIANYRIDRLERIVEVEIKKYLETFEKRDLKTNIYNQAIKQKNIEGEIREINKKLKISESILKELKNKVVSTIMLGNDLIIKNINNKLQQTKNNITMLSDSKEQLQKEKDNIEFKIATLEKSIPNWNREFDFASLEQKREILKKLIDKIVLYNDKIEIFIKYPIDSLVIAGQKEQYEES